MRSLVLFLALLFCSPAAAQRVEPPPQESKWYLTIYTHSDWASRPAEKLLIDSLNQEPMKTLKSKVQFKHYTERDPVYAAGRFPTIPVTDFPVVTFGRADGGYIYKASKDTMPLPGVPLYEAIRESYKRDKVVPPEPVVPLDVLVVEQDSFPSPDFPSPEVNRDPIFPNAPWNIDNQIDDSIEGLFGGDTPVRDSLGYVAWVMGAIVMLFFLGVLGVGGIALLAVMLIGFRAFVR